MKEGFRKTAAFQPRVLKRNRGSAGEGVWLVWLADETTYCSNYGDRELRDDEALVLMEMCDNHVERHTVGEFLAFCVSGADAPGAGAWASSHPGGFFDDASSTSSATSSATSSRDEKRDDAATTAAAHVVDQRLLPRIAEGEVRLLMVREEVFQIVHKKLLAVNKGMDEHDGYANFRGALAMLRLRESQLKEVKAMRAAFAKALEIPRSDIVGMDPEPFAQGSYGSVHRATYEGDAVAVKAIRVSALPASERGLTIREV